MTSSGVLRALGLFTLLFGAWLLWSGLYKPLLIGLGLFSCALTVYLAKRMEFLQHVSALHVLPRLAGYWVWVAKEVFKSSIDVTKIVLDLNTSLATHTQ